MFKLHSKNLPPLVNCAIAKVQAETGVNKGGETLNTESDFDVLNQVCFLCTID